VVEGVVGRQERLGQQGGPPMVQICPAVGHDSACETKEAWYVICACRRSKLGFENAYLDLERACDQANTHVRVQYTQEQGWVLTLQIVPNAGSDTSTGWH
jgi:hypothetical protein